MRKTVVSTISAAAIMLALVSVAGMNTASASLRTEGASGLSACPAATGAVEASELKAGKSAWACALVGRLVTHNGVGVYIQPAGKGVTVSADSPAGGVSLDVTTSPDGVVTANYEGPPSAAAANPPRSGTIQPAPSVVTATDPACSMTANNFAGYKWDGDYPYFRVNTTAGLPSNISGATFLSTQKSAGNHIHSAFNNCGIVANPTVWPSAGPYAVETTTKKQQHQW